MAANESSNMFALRWEVKIQLGSKHKTANRKIATRITAMRLRAARRLTVSLSHCHGSGDHFFNDRQPH